MVTGLRSCKCGHVEGTHWAGDEVEEALVGHPLPYRCHAKTRGKDCDCTRFRPKKSGSRVKRFLTGRP
jgi:hypothetical protein